MGDRQRRISSSGRQELGAKPVRQEGSVKRSPAAGALSIIWVRPVRLREVKQFVQGRSESDTRNPGGWGWGGARRLPETWSHVTSTIFPRKGGVAAGAGKRSLQAAQGGGCVSITRG